MIVGLRLLYVDGPQEIQEVLSAVLAPRGLQVDWRPSHVAVVPGEAADTPDLVVIDAEAVPICRPTQRRDWGAVPRVILGEQYAEDSGKTSASPCEQLAKPYHYPELVQAIERLLATSQS